MPLSAANVVQAKTGSIGGGGATSADITLDNPTTAGNTVTVEMHGPAVWPGMPPGWDFDGSYPDVGPILWVFRLSGAASPGGETSWTWTTLGPSAWMWRVTEWDVGLDPVDPFEIYAGNVASGASVPTFSSGTTATTNRAEVVALAMFRWSFAGGADPTRTFGFGPYTNGFTERDEVRVNGTAGEFDAAWAWAFAEATGTFETTATVTSSSSSSQDSYFAQIAVYAATVPVVVPAPTVMTSSGGGP